MDEDDFGYYRGRARVARQMADEASEDYIAAIHLELARRYQALADNMVLRPKLRIVVRSINDSSPIAGE